MGLYFSTQQETGLLLSIVLSTKPSVLMLVAKIAFEAVFDSIYPSCDILLTFLEMSSITQACYELSFH